MFYIAEVRDNKDPTGTGRVKVRFFNRENDEKNIPDSGLKWAHPMLPTTAMTSGGIGHKPMAPPIGSRVMCVYLADDDTNSYPYYIGCVVRSEKADESGIQQVDRNTGAPRPNIANANPDGPGEISSS